MAYRNQFQQLPHTVAISGHWLTEQANQMGNILTKLTDIDQQQNSTVSWLGAIKNRLDTATDIVEEREERHRNLTYIIENLTRENNELRERLTIIIADLQNGQSRILQAIGHLDKSVLSSLVIDNPAAPVHDILTRVTRMENDHRKRQEDIEKGIQKLDREWSGLVGKFVEVSLYIIGGSAFAIFLTIMCAKINSSIYRSSIVQLITDIKSTKVRQIDSLSIVQRLSEIIC